jgi:hypothetical protein
VRDVSRDNDWRDPAAGAGGDVSRRDQVAVTGEPAMRAGEDPPGWLGDTFEALGAGGGGAPFVDQDHGDSGLLGFVGQGGDQVTDAPVTDPPVVPPPSGQGQHATRIAHRHSADPPLHGPADDHGCGFVLGLGHPAPVPRLDPTLAAPVLAPAPGRCGTPPWASSDHVAWACSKHTTTHRQNHPTQHRTPGGAPSADNEALGPSRPDELTTQPLACHLM